MKLPKDLQRNKPRPKNNYFTVNKAFDFLRRKFQYFNSIPYAEKEEFFHQIIERTKNRNSKQLYKLIRQKTKALFEDINFQCLRCKPSCCNFQEYELLIYEISLYREDFDLVKTTGGDTNGFAKDYPESLFEEFKGDLIKIFNMNLDLEDFNYNRRLSRELLGYSNRLLVMRKPKEKRGCYYYKDGNHTCSIHNQKPITCLTYPLRIQNTSKKFGIMYAEDCKWLKKQVSKLGHDGFANFIQSFISYWEYLLSVDLYLRSKGRFEIKNGKIIEKEIFKQIQTREERPD